MYTARSFNLAILELILLAVIISGLFIMATTDVDAIHLLMGSPLLILCLASALGSWFAIRSLKEPSTFRRNLGILVNFAFMLLFLFLIIGNVLDLIRWYRGL